MTVYEVVLSGVLAGQFVQTVQHLGTESTPAQQGFAIAKSIILPINFSTILANFLACLPEDYELTSVRCRQVFPDTSATAITLASEYMGSTGGRTGEISSAQVNPVMLWIPTTEPTKIGKLFFPGVSESDIDQMQLVAALITAYYTFADSWMTGLTLDLENYVGMVARRSATSPYAVTAGDVIEFRQISPLIGTQRRRLRPV